MKHEVWFESGDRSPCSSPGRHSLDGQLFNSLDAGLEGDGGSRQGAGGAGSSSDSYKPHRDSAPVLPSQTSCLCCLGCLCETGLEGFNLLDHFLRHLPKQQTKQTGILLFEKVGLFHGLSHLLKSHCLRKCSASWRAGALHTELPPFPIKNPLLHFLFSLVLAA